MGIATTSPAARIEPGARPAQSATGKIVPPNDGPADRESLAENFNRAIEAWARHALGANGFGDCP